MKTFGSELVEWHQKPELSKQAGSARNASVERSHSTLAKMWDKTDVQEETEYISEDKSI